MPGPGLARPLRYGLLGMPLAFAALPLYVQWPAHATSHWGLPLAGLGLLLLAVRLADALVDPLAGRWADAAFTRAPRQAWILAGGATALMVAGVAALFLAPAPGGAASPLTWWWAAGLLAITSWAYSVALVVHQAWAARLGGDASAQARWVGTREGCALAGVVLASVLPAWLGWPATAGLLAALALLAWLALGRVLPMAGGAAPEPSLHAAAPAPAGPSPWRQPAFRALLAVYALNALASAVPATLVLFFVRDVLQADARTAGALLGLYFIAAALAVPLWVYVVDRHGLLAVWAAGMALAIASFAGAGLLGAGDVPAFAAVCTASGLALGADLVAAPTLLAQLHQRQAQASARADQGLWFGWWALVGKLMLALAAGLALPLVQALGYQPGQRQPDSAAALAMAYAWLPCLIKAAALAALIAWRRLLSPSSTAAFARAATQALP
ncbi:Sugar transporter [Rubrivivax sp. A210]|uniref:MFS transporter n=1 Tax=Rubrivivax sp. A210 TaxID=2772301 RepID=UPI00191A95A3|nr:MFS transporter [Rubrivivax sp. A210]CAD5367027.1 Sugar transporter [Rubrivivax sp. A210]